MIVQKFGHKSTTQHKVFNSGNIETAINDFCLLLANDTVNTFSVTQIVYVNSGFAYVVYSSISADTSFDPTQQFI